jgi:transglutaminase-like putative cysteine protease
MKYGMAVILALAMSTGVAAQDVPGKVSASFPLPLKTPTGLAFDGSHFWLADFDTATLNELDPSTGRVLRALDAPGYAPMGLAWDGSSLWILDSAEKTVFALDPKSGRTLRALPLDTDNPEGLAWDGKDLWVADARAGQLVRLDQQDGTTFLTVPCPTAKGPRKTQEIGMTVAGPSLYVSDRITDAIYRLDLKTGTLLDYFAAPGPYATGLAWDGEHLWCADYEARTLYKLQATTSAPYVTFDPKHELVTFTEAWKNFGPGTVSTLDVYIAVPQDLPTQTILRAPEFEPAPADFVTDQWGQKCAHFLFKDVKAGEEVKAVMKVEAEVRSVRWFVDPDRIGALAEIPADIRSAYTRDSSKFVTTDPVIRKAVKEAVGDEKNPYWMARKINAHIQDKMTYELVGGWNVAPTVLERGSGSCSEYTFVMLSMCHAAGLPARYAGSVVVRGDDASRDDVFHRWVEVYLPNYGWVPVDPSGGDSRVPVEQAKMFGGLDNRFLITTLGAGDSKYLGWDYNSFASWTAEGRVKLMQRKAGEWEPVGKKYEPKVAGEPGR